jgi:hypothetical protein
MEENLEFSPLLGDDHADDISFNESSQEELGETSHVKASMPSGGEYASVPKARALCMCTIYP